MSAHFNPFISKIDGAVFQTLEELNLHIRKVHKIKLERYYVEFDKKFDLHDGSQIEFKNPEFYNSVLFNNRANLLSYYKNNKENVPLLNKITKDCLSLRARSKRLVFAPSTFECKTAILPSPYLCYHFGVDYNQICKDIGLQTRYLYDQEILFDNKIALEILKDTREQLPLNLNAKIIKTKLDVGDYACKNNFKNFVIERKSLSDLISTHSAGFERFVSEIQRAKESGTYIVVLCEDKLDNLIGFDKLKDFSRLKATPTFICKRIRTIYEAHDNIQYLFAENRTHAARLLDKLFKIENNIRELDCQFLLETEKI